jgi:hypothetical protein
MTNFSVTARRDARAADALLRSTIVTLTLVTAAVHASLGGLLFTANAVGYAVLAVLMVLPGPLGHFRMLVRLALIAFTVATIGGWLLFGVRFPLAYFDKAVEVALVMAVGFELWYVDGGPAGITRRVRDAMQAVLRAAR